MSGNQPSEDEFNTYGGMLAATYFGTSILGGALVTIQLFMVASGLSRFAGTPKEKRQGRAHFLLIGCVILTTFSAQTFIDIWLNYDVLFHGGPNGKSYLEANSIMAQNNTTALLVGDVVLLITIVAGDILMLWRCLILWSSKKWVVILPALCWLSSVVCYIVYVVRSASSSSSAEDAGKALVGSVSLGVAANIMFTLLILFRIALTWRETRQAFPNRRVPRMYSDSVSILVESATPLAIFGICLVVSGSIRTSWKSTSLIHKGRLNILYEVSGWLYYGFCALSPQMIIYRITTGQSWKDPSNEEPESISLSRVIQFAPSPAETRSTGSKEVG